MTRPTPAWGPSSAMKKLEENGEGAGSKTLGALTLLGLGEKPTQKLDRNMQELLRKGDYRGHFFPHYPHTMCVSMCLRDYQGHFFPHFPHTMCVSMCLSILDHRHVLCTDDLLAILGHPFRQANKPRVITEFEPTWSHALADSSSVSPPAARLLSIRFCKQLHTGER